jgi:hypothetical protein
LPNTPAATAAPDNANAEEINSRLLRPCVFLDKVFSFELAAFSA